MCSMSRCIEDKEKEEEIQNVFTNYSLLPLQNIEPGPEWRVNPTA